MSKYIFIFVSSLLYTSLAFVDEECLYKNEMKEHPHVVSIELLNGDFKDIQFHVCTGVLITPDLVLATASCIEGLRYDQAENGTLYGNTEVSVSPYCRHQRGPQQFPVNSFYFHPQYRKPDIIFNNDLAIIALERNNSNPQNGVETFKSDNSSESYLFFDFFDVNFTVSENIDTKVVSYGQKNNEDRVNNFTARYYLDVLVHDVDEIRMVDMELCKNWFYKQGATRDILEHDYFEGFICGYALTGDLCVGDYGAPAVIKGSEVNVLLGILSWMPFKDCNTGTKVPLMFTNLAFYQEWIYSMIDEYETYGGFLGTLN
eukprot:TRINITY_DN16051_c0_g1_i4.p2 TRINITY_DN16051_c0_g1~~TRINITY_DN16051_c0_g1_i4.p2  ORF type:complete len:316 (-),score=36.78 TRINITY_DN16051_c0_g1_i4:170-1117(-)